MGLSSSHHPTSLADLTRRRSGFIDRNELGQLAVKIGRTMTDDDLDAAMLQMDADNSGEIDFEEFFAWFSDVMEGDEATRKAFDKADVDGSGCIERREVKQVLLDLGHSREQVTRAFLDEAMAEMDDDGSGEVSFEEFREWWNKQLTQQVLEHHGTDRDPHEEYLTNYWSKADADGSGILDRDELQGLMARLGRLLQEEELDVAFAIMDEDGSGGIEYDEFSNWFEWLQAEDLTIGRLFDQVDKDDSGMLDREEVG